MASGWIITHRKMMDCWIWENPLYLKAWMHLLYTVNHSDKKILFDRELITVKRGQLITSQRKLAEAWGCSVMTVRAILDLMCKDEMITVETDRKKTLLTVVNYDVYQFPETDSRTETITETRTDSRTVSRTPSRTVSRTKQLININTINSKNENECNECDELILREGEEREPPASAGTPAPSAVENTIQRVTCQMIVDLFNEICISFPQVKTISENRRKAINARLRIYGLEDFKTLFRKAEASDFLKGSNGRDWSATFDWLIKDANMAKVLDGNYDNRTKNTPKEESKEEYLRRKALEWGYIPEEENNDETGNTEIIDSD